LQSVLVDKEGLWLGLNETTEKIVARLAVVHLGVCTRSRQAADGLQELWPGLVEVVRLLIGRRRERSDAMDDGATKNFWCRSLVRGEELEKSRSHLQLLDLVGHLRKARVGQDHSSEENACKDTRLERVGGRADDFYGETDGVVGMSGTKLVISRLGCLAGAGGTTLERAKELEVLGGGLGWGGEGGGVLSEIF
jgi:hypothetical protein